MKYVLKFVVLIVLAITSGQLKADKIFQDPRVGFVIEHTEVHGLDGKKVNLTELWKEKPVLLITGSLSCPFTRQSLKPSHKLVRRFGSDFHIVMLYVVDAHPKGDVSPYSNEEWIPRDNFKDKLLFPQPKTMSERTDRANQLNRLLDLKVPVLIDDMENPLWSELGRFPNAGILIDKTGEVIFKQKKFKARAMAKQMSHYLKTGKVKTKKPR